MADDASHDDDEEKAPRKPGRVPAANAREERARGEQLAGET